MLQKRKSCRCFQGLNPALVEFRDSLGAQSLGETLAAFRQEATPLPEWPQLGCQSQFQSHRLTCLTLSRPFERADQIIVILLEPGQADLRLVSPHIRCFFLCELREIPGMLQAK